MGLMMFRHSFLFPWGRPSDGRGVVVGVAGSTSRRIEPKSPALLRSFLGGAFPTAILPLPYGAKVLSGSRQLRGCSPWDFEGVGNDFETPQKQLVAIIVGQLSGKFLHRGVIGSGCGLRLRPGWRQWPAGGGGGLLLAWCRRRQCGGVMVAVIAAAVPVAAGVVTPGCCGGGGGMVRRRPSPGGWRAGVRPAACPERQRSD
jgi:hypothetical protein